MNIDEIIKNRENLERKLRVALSTMERSDEIKKIRREIIDNQKHCPHFSEKYNWTIANGVCPYCDFVLDENGRSY